MRPWQLADRLPDGIPEFEVRAQLLTGDVNLAALNPQTPELAEGKCQSPQGQHACDTDQPRREPVQSRIPLSQRNQAGRAVKRPRRVPMSHIVHATYLTGSMWRCGPDRRYRRAISAAIPVRSTVRCPLDVASGPLAAPPCGGYSWAAPAADCQPP